MIKLIDLNYYSHNDCSKPLELIERHWASLGFGCYIKEMLDVTFVKHMNYEGSGKLKGLSFVFFKSRNKFCFIPFKTHRFIKSEKPDVVLIQGLVFPLQLIALRLMVGKECRIIVQHHGEIPSRGIKKIVQKKADKFIDAYLFTSLGNAKEWIHRRIISGAKCFESLEASTCFSKQDKEESKKLLGITGNHNFLFVGRLTTLKDPLLILDAFKQYVKINSAAKLYMIYQTEELLAAIKEQIERSRFLQSSVCLQGMVPHDQLQHWYSAMDFYISASHKEGSGYALLEAMTCGCVPIVTAIPSFEKITANGRYALLFKVGDSNGLLQRLQDSERIDREAFSKDITDYFSRELSFQNIAASVFAVCKRLAGK